MRPLPVETLPDMPPFLLGVSVIRDAVVPVVDVAALTTAAAHAPPARYVTLGLGGGRCVGLAVQAVVGVRLLAIERLKDIPPLLRDAAADHVSAMMLLDAELLWVLQSTQLIPDSMWREIDPKALPA